MGLRVTYACHRFSFALHSCLGTSVVAQSIKNLPAVQETTRSAGARSSIPGSGRSTGEGNVNPLQYSCLKNSMDREACWDAVHRVAKSWTRLSLHTHTNTDTHTFKRYVEIVHEGSICRNVEGTSQESISCSRKTVKVPKLA